MSVAKVDNGKMTLAIDLSIPKGIYSVYLSENGKIDNAPWFDVYLDPALEQTLIVNWDANSGIPDFKNSDENRKYTAYRNSYAKLKSNVEKLDNFQRSFDYASATFKKDLAEIREQLQKSTDSLLHIDHKKEVALWQNYFPVMHLYSETPPALEQFWDLFPIDDESIFHSPAIQVAQYQYHALLRKKYQDRQEIDSIVIATLYEKVSRTRAGFSYFRDWLHAWLDNNETQKLYLQGIKLLSESSAASFDEKKIYSDEWIKKKLIQPGKIFQMRELENKMQEFSNQKKEKLIIIFFSADCHFCVEELEKLNKDKNYTGNIVAVNVNANDKNENKKWTAQYPNILFIYPSDPASVKEKFAFRGTPSSYEITFKNKEWIIKEMY
ncbi:peroxiredoxin family protein [uncultured Chryseobacterium sp.]|uniref:peroxiredoxin family protein n=1 Tax=uncultured Chryseobacterium sp. TaxID=259322 RepID=UPI003748BEF2